MKQLSNLTIKNIFKKSFSLTLILIILVTNIVPLQVYADSPTPTPPPSSDTTLQIVSDLSVPATESADQNTIQPSFEQMGPSSPQLAFTPPMFVLGLAKANFQGKEQIELTVKYSENEDVTVSIEGADQDAPVSIEEEKVNGDTVFTLQPSANLKPGNYTIKVIDNSTSEIISTQDFTWGVLAINTDKSIYLPQETADISLAVLDEKGDMVCTAIVDLDIVSPTGVSTRLSTRDGSIVVNPACRLHQFSLEPDYQTSYQTTSTGRYTMTLTATTGNGSYSTKDRFEVRESVPFDVQRQTSTRIYPPSTYPVRLKIHANEDFVGKIIESVPTAFQISKLDEPGVYAYAEESPILANLQYEKDYGIPDLHLPFNENFPVSQGFGQQIDDPEHRDAYKKSGLDGHDGIDFALPEKTPIVAVDAGKIILAKENWIYGTSVVIQHAWGRTYYGHLSKLSVAEGENVTKGMQIGLSGSTGLSTGPHLHFGLKPKDNDIDNLYFGKIDPSKFLGIASEDPVLTISEYPKATKALIWNVKIAKGADFIIGYQYLAPPKSPDFYTIGPLQFISSQKLPEEQAKFDININPFVLGTATASATLTAVDTKDRVIFQEIRPWQLAIDVATTVVLTSASSNPWTIPNSWNSDDNKIEVVGPGGTGGTSGIAKYGGGGGGGGAYAYTTNLSLTAGATATFQIGTGGSGNATWFSTSGTVNAGAGGNGGTASAGTAGAVGAGTGFSGGAGGSGVGPDLGETSSGGGGGGGGAAGPNGLGRTGGDGGAIGQNGIVCGGGGGGGNGGGGIGSNADTCGATGIGGAGGNGNGGTGSGSAGSTSNGGNATTKSGGGGGGGAGTATGTFYAGGNGAASIDMAAGLIGSGGGGGGGGGNIRTSATGNNGGAGGSPTANTGAGGGGGGGCLDTGCANGAGQTGANGYIVITWTPKALTLDMVMRHGKWFDNGAEAATFTF